MEAVTTATLVSVENAAEMRQRWPRFAAFQQHEYASAHCVPLRLRDRTIGSLNLFRETEGPLNPEDAIAVRALADVATIIRPCPDRSDGVEQPHLRVGRHTPRADSAHPTRR